ncbi:MAG: hypothetical protein DRQ45_07975 [Gammaproteobacteria bacterium]|nr:MAG: hypothetical protein DRQ45_07975 [Gammaproteobacteria bacterium]
MGDITYLWTAEGWLYLAVLLDLYSPLSANMYETRGPRGISVEGGEKRTHVSTRKNPPGSGPRSDGGDSGRA